MRCAKTAVLLAVIAVVASLVWLRPAPGDGTAAHPVPDGYALDLVTHGERYWSDAAVLGDAEDKLVRQCMRDAGFAMTPASPAGAGPEHGELSGVDLAYRRRHGYGLAEARTTARPPAAEPSPDYNRAMTGDNHITVRINGRPAVVVAASGCQGRARAALAGSVYRWATALYTPDFLNDDLIRAVAADPARPRLLRGWRDCMARRGYRFTDYDQPRALVQRKLDETGPKYPAAAEEREVATADGACLIEGRVIETGIALRRAAALRMAPQWTLELVQAARIRRAAVDNAGRISGGRP
jgi:hypothetical protein